MIESGDSSAQLAYDVFIHRLRKYIGAYLAILGRTDVVSFTAGVGENAAAVRRDALSGLAALGIEIDEQRNAQSANDARRISADTSPITVLVIPTNEELAIARDCLRAIELTPVPERRRRLLPPAGAAGRPQGTGRRAVRT